MAVHTLYRVFIDQLKDIYSAEHQLIKLLPNIAYISSNKLLQQNFFDHDEETKNQIGRLNEIVILLNGNLTGKKNLAVEAITNGIQEILKTGGTEELVEIMLIASIQQMKHYEISAYTTALTYAEALDFGTIMTLLNESLKEEILRKKKLAALSKKELLPLIHAQAKAVGNLVDSYF